MPKSLQQNLMTSVAGNILPASESSQPADEASQEHPAQQDDDSPRPARDSRPIRAEADEFVIAQHVRDRDGDGDGEADEKPLDIYLTAKQVRARNGGVSDMSVWRWLRDPKLAFPQPIRINRRRFWRRSSLDAWDLSREGAR